MHITLQSKNSLVGNAAVSDIVMIKGEPGEQGPVGPQGPRGDKGETGATGPQGPKGDKGDKGDTGPQGSKGDKGDTGPQGIPGIAAQVRINSETQMWEYANEYDEQGNPVWISSDLKAVGEKGDKGDPGAIGPQGPKGDKGDSFTYSDFTPEQLEALRGSAGPKGDKGETGSTGPKGDKGDPGANGPQGPAGSDGFSPVMDVENITGGHRVHITDKNGLKTFDVMDGKDGDGSSGGGGKAIIDVLELPTENINESAFYRLMTAEFVYHGEPVDVFTCYCVDGLPENPLPVTTDMESGVFYYNVQDGAVSGYVDAMVSAGSGLPVGWYAIDILAQAFDVAYDGIINNISDSKDDIFSRLLLKHEFYLYKNGWAKVPFAYELPPKIDIRWDGVIGDKFALDMSSLGYANTYMVKVSDEVFTMEQLIGCTFTNTSGYENVISYVDDTSFPGAYTLEDGGAVVIYSADDTSTALGLPSGYLTNGTYFAYVEGEMYSDRLVSPPNIVKIDSKYVDVEPVDLTVIQEMIDSAIGNAIGGSY